ncbi:MAG: hypothetical protein ACUVSQ_06105 [Pseudanabaenaceae cyanobacterium]
MARLPHGDRPLGDNRLKTRTIIGGAAPLPRWGRGAKQVLTRSSPRVRAGFPVRGNFRLTHDELDAWLTARSGPEAEMKSARGDRQLG